MDNISAEVTAIALKQATRSAKAHRDAALKWRAEAERLEVELAVARKRGAESDEEVKRLTSELADARKLIETLVKEEPPAVVDPPKVEPPVVKEPPVKVDPSTVEGPWPHAYTGLGVAAAKEARPRGWDEARKVLDRPRKERAQHLYMSPVGDLEVLDLDVTGPVEPYIQKLFSVSPGAIDGQGADMLMENLRWAPKEPQDLKALFWFARLYRLHNATFRGLTIEGQTYELDGRQRPQEHGIYFNTCGDALWEWCKVTGLGGKPYYDAHRSKAYAQYGADNAPYYRETTSTIRGCVAIDNEQDPAKGSYNASFFDRGSHEHPSTIKLENSVFAMEWPYIRDTGSFERYADLSNPRAIQACGGFMNTYYQNAVKGKYACREFVVDECLFSMRGNNSNDVGVVRDAETVILRGSTFDAYESRGNKIHLGGPQRFMRGTMDSPKNLILEDCQSATDLEIWWWDDNDKYERIKINDSRGKQLVMNR